MADNGKLNAQLLEHIGGNFACECALFRPVDILSAKADIAALYELGCQSQVNVGGADNNVALCILHQGLELVYEFLCLGGGHVHLPVACDNGLTHSIYLRFLSKILYYLSSRAATPGRVLPSRNSRLAPPPVEIWVILSA